MLGKVSPEGLLNMNYHETFNDQNKKVHNYVAFLLTFTLLEPKVMKAIYCR